MKHTISEADILCYFTNLPTPRMQKIVRAASCQGRVGVIYWNRSGIDFRSGLSDCATEISVSASFLHNRGICRIIAFLIFACKSWRLLRRAEKARIVYVNYLDVLLIAACAFCGSGVKFIYGIGDLSTVQYGGMAMINNAVRLLEKALLKRVHVLILSSPFFWSEYYSKIYSGRWQLIENMPRAEVWALFRPREIRVPCVVGYIGWIRDHRPIECLLTAVGELRKEGFDALVFFAGFGPDEDRVKRMAADMDYVSFRGPYQYNLEAPALYSEVNVIFSVFDVGVANSKILMPNRFYDAIACGIPLIVARDTKLADRVLEMGIGYAVDYMSAEQMKAALKSYMACDDEAKRIAIALQSVERPAYFYDQYNRVLSDMFASDRH